MARIISQREPDGSTRYSHCYSEDVPTHPGFEQRFRFRLVQPTRPLRRIRLFGAAFVVAAAMFWGTMLTSPPTSEAGLYARATSSCIERGRITGLWFERELPRRAWARKGQQEFNQMLAWFNAATNQCAAGLAQRSAENFRALEGLIASLEQRPRSGDDSE